MPVFMNFVDTQERLAEAFPFERTQGPLPTELPTDVMVGDLIDPPSLVEFWVNESRRAIKKKKNIMARWTNYDEKDLVEFERELVLADKYLWEYAGEVHFKVVTRVWVQGSLHLNVTVVDTGS